MPQAVRLLCPWDRHVDVQSTWPRVNSIGRETVPVRRRNLSSISAEVSAGAVPVGLWPLFETTHRLRRGLIMFRPRRGLAAWLFNVPFVPQASATKCGAKKSLPFSGINIVGRTRSAPAAQRRNINSPARKCPRSCHKNPSPLRRMAPLSTR
jgi:hypothetical protein